MVFTVAQLKALNGKLDRRHVQTRKVDDRDIDYIEGWFAISQANTIFGFSGWDRETAHLERISERSRGDTTTCTYLARVRIRIRAGKDYIIREGTGVGSATSKITGEAYERAIKAAETDATKRALATFGNRFGLCLYDKEQAGVTPRVLTCGFSLKDHHGKELADGLSPEAFCSGLRQVVQILATQDEVLLCRQQNESEIARLRTASPDLRTNKGIHFADVLERVLDSRLDQLAARPVASLPVSAPPAAEVPLSDSGETKSQRDHRGCSDSHHVDKSTLAISVIRRARDKDHLRQVATLPCVICEEMPTHAHHITFAQPRGLALKVSDEYVVPLCAVHHNDLHRRGSERLWWQRSGLDPIPIAKSLWDGHLNRRSAGASEPNDLIPASPTQNS